MGILGVLVLIGISHAFLSHYRKAARKISDNRRALWRLRLFIFAGWFATLVVVQLAALLVFGERLYR